MASSTSAPTSTTPNSHVLPKILTNPSHAPPVLIVQGAEALLYRTTYLLPSIPAALKYRPSKPYRHPILDARLTRHRILSEARVLAKCRREGVDVPAVYALDEKEGWLMVEWIEGDVVRVRLNAWIRSKKEKHHGEGRVEMRDEAVLKLMERIGRQVGRLHEMGVVHGDLTTSNLMLRDEKRDEGDERAAERGLGGQVVLIDFGLASQSTADEDRAVDLYVLERAFGSTHPSAEALFEEVLRAYGESYKGAKPALKKLDEVRMRGRKKTMIG